MNEAKFNKKYLDVFNTFKYYYKTEGYELDCVDKVYLPFWFCKQEIIVETAIEADKFSKILLNLVDSEIKKHTEICAFLGIKEDDFTLMQLHFLISNGFLEENKSKNRDLCYEITYEGRNFLNDKKDTLQNIECIEYEYIINDLDYLTEEKYKTFYNDLTKEFFDKDKSIDKNTSKKFSGYKLKVTHELLKGKENKNLPKNHIPHSDKPTLKKIKNSNFVKFFNDNYSGGIFYDFGNSKIEAHKRSILFYFLHYKNEDGEFKIAIRHCKSSVNKFDGKKLERILSEETKKYIIEKNKTFVEKLKDVE